MPEITREFAEHVAKFWTTNELGEVGTERLLFARPGSNHFRIDAIACDQTIVVNGDLGAMVFLYHQPRSLRNFSTYSADYALDKINTSDRLTATKLMKERLVIILHGMRLAFAQLDAAKAVAQ